MEVVILTPQRDNLCQFRENIAHIELNDFDSENCVALENVSILNLSLINKINMTTVAPLYDDDADEDIVIKTSLDDVLYNYDVGTMSNFESELVTYIAGFVVHYLLQKLSVKHV